ncbi:DsbA family oxidoreductase [Oceanomicrobium pacificus]|uniref:DsbA family oxidoreductase n=1 Tax=Oceanomicrobium pacificus TaxID=2692916 RepID=A0A6B0TUP7_9RHOB|nr:DsbA family oxidoreductase [Oceanomicrobium pacificus]MXU66529.1 DsbA family oxidoreductase [Oceanomicrobium pacificus]
MTDHAISPLRVDIISDVVCPWCIIGYRQLAAAAEAEGAALEVHWHPFELNPDMVPEGEDLREHVARKYGSSTADSDAARARLSSLGAELGFDIRFTPDSRIYNTFQAHQLLHWAGTLGQEHALKMALFAAYFTDRRDVSDPAVLVEICQNIGLDAAEAKAVLEDARYAQTVREAEAVWTRQGIRGVPAMIFSGRYLVSGAQGIENYRKVLQQLADAPQPLDA